MDYVPICGEGLSMAINTMYDNWKLRIMSKYHLMNAMFMPSLDN